MTTHAHLGHRFLSLLPPLHCVLLLLLLLRLLFYCSSPFPLTSFFCLPVCFDCLARVVSCPRDQIKQFCTLFVCMCVLYAFLPSVSCSFDFLLQSPLPVLWFLSLVNKPPSRVCVSHVHFWIIILLRFHSYVFVYFLLHRWHCCFSPF